MAADPPDGKRLVNATEYFNRKNINDMFMVRLIRTSLFIHANNGDTLSALGIITFWFLSALLHTATICFQ